MEYAEGRREGRRQGRRERSTVHMGIGEKEIKGREKEIMGREKEIMGRERK